MDWLRKKIIAWVREDWQNSHDRREEISIDVETTIGLEDPIRIELQGVVGGHVFRVRHPYDSKTNRTPSTTYLIPSGEDIGTKIAKIINLELIK